jgi:hypothetical protein
MGINPYQLSYTRGDFMSYRDQLDDQSKLFHKNHTRRKHLNSQVNGETQVTQNTIRARGNAKAHRMF